MSKNSDMESQIKRLRRQVIGVQIVLVLLFVLFVFKVLLPTELAADTVRASTLFLASDDNIAGALVGSPKGGLSFTGYEEDQVVLKIRIDPTKNGDIRIEINDHEHLLPYSRSVVPEADFR